MVHSIKPTYRMPLNRWLTDENYYQKSLSFLEIELFTATAAWVSFENAVTLDQATKVPLTTFDSAWDKTAKYITDAHKVLNASRWKGRLKSSEAQKIVAALGQPPKSCFAIYMITISNDDGSNEECVYIGRTNSINHRFKSGHHSFTKLHADKYKSMRKRLYLGSLWLEDDDDHTFPIEWFRDIDRDDRLNDIESQLIYDLQPLLNSKGKRTQLAEDEIHVCIQNTVSRTLDAHCLGPDRDSWRDC